MLEFLISVRLPMVFWEELLHVSNKLIGKFDIDSLKDQASTLSIRSLQALLLQGRFLSAFIISSKGRKFQPYISPPRPLLP